MFAPPSHHHCSVRVDPACRALSKGETYLIVHLVHTESFSLVLRPVMCLGCKVFVERIIFKVIFSHVVYSLFTCIFVCLWCLFVMFLSILLVSIPYAEGV